MKVLSAPVGQCAGSYSCPSTSTAAHQVPRHWSNSVVFQLSPRKCIKKLNKKKRIPENNTVALREKVGTATTISQREFCLPVGRGSRGFGKLPQSWAEVHTSNTKSSGGPRVSVALLPRFSDLGTKVHRLRRDRNSLSECLIQAYTVSSIICPTPPNRGLVRIVIIAEHCPF